ncbi:MAG: hypothetical protein ABIX46_04175 [Burkholderiaceae bacterium]
MRDFDDSTLWRISAYERMREEGGGASGFARLDGVATLLPTTLLADLQSADGQPRGSDVLEVMATLLRHRESALLYLRHQTLVWPITVFAQRGLCHAPRDLTESGARDLSDLGLLAFEPPGLQPPGHWQHERIGDPAHYRPLEALFWHVALRGPRMALLPEIDGGSVAYRALRAPDGVALRAPGALGSAHERLLRDTASLRDIAGWPGMSLERACRLLNAMYLTTQLMVMRSHPAARASGEPRRAGLSSLSGLWKTPRQ